MANYVPSYSYIGHWPDFIILSTLTAYLFCASAFLTEQNYSVKIPIAELLKKIFKQPDEDSNEFNIKAVKFLTKIPLGVFPILFIYVLISEYKSDSVVWFAFFVIYVFTAFLFLSMNYALRKNRPLKAAIYMENGDAIADVVLLKMNEDHVRLRSGDKILLIPKNRILKIEMPIEQKGI